MQHITEDDMNTPSIKEQIIAYDESLKKKSDKNSILPRGGDVYNDLFENDTNRTSDNNEAFSMPEIAKRDNVDDSVFGSLVGAEVIHCKEYICTM